MAYLAIVKGLALLMPSCYFILYWFLVALSLPVFASTSTANTGSDQLLGKEYLKADSPQNEDIVIDSLSRFFSVVSVANKSHQYTNLLTYEANGYITTFKLNHRIDNGVVYQQLVFMDGPERQVFRQQGQFHCGLKQPRLGVWPSALQNASLSTYSFRTIGYERIANRRAVIFDILPKDEFRYGYRYSIDQKTGLILKVMTFHKGTIVERLQTVSLDLIDKASDLAFDKSTAYTWRVSEVDLCYTEQFRSGWQVGWLPKGFSAVGNRVTSKGEQVLIFTDGLVSVSIFIINKKAVTLPKVTAHHGATVVVVAPVLSKLERSIAVVGEIPVATARRIAVSVKPQ